MRRFSSVLLVALVACRSSQPTTERAAGGSAAAGSALPAERGGRTHVRVDRRVEVMAILQRLADQEPYRRPLASPYARAVDATFARFANHPAVAATRALRREHSISWDAPMLLAVHLDAGLRPVNAAELPAIDPRFAGVDVAAYAAHVRDFATAADLDGFLASQRPYVTRVERALREVVDAERPIDWFDAMFGARARARYIVVPGLLTGTMNYGVRATLPDGTEELYQVMGIDTPTGLPRVDEDLVALLVHELAHSYVNPALARHHAALEPAGTALYRHVARPMQAQAYGDWKIMLNEAVVRAVTTLYLEERKGAAAGARRLRAERRLGFVWTSDLVALLRRLPRERARFRDLEAFVPELVGQLARLAEQAVAGPPPTPFEGPFTMVLWRDPAWLVPARGPAASFARAMAERFGPSAPRAAPSLAALAAHGDRDVVTYGAPATNPVVARIAEAAGWRVTPDAITLGGRTFAGPHLVLIACWPRPDAPTRGVAIYTAADDADLVGINGVHHGGTDWVVARRQADGTFVVLGQGDFARAPDGAWRLP